MAKVDTVYIHNDAINAESLVPEHTVAGWQAQGWEPGPLPEAQAERDAAAEANLAALQMTAAAEEATLAQAEPVEAAIEPTAAPTSETPSDVQSLEASQQTVDRRPGVRGPAPTGANTPNPEEG